MVGIQTTALERAYLLNFAKGYWRMMNKKRIYEAHRVGFRILSRAACAALCGAALAAWAPAREQVVIRKSASDPQNRGASIYIDQQDSQQSGLSSGNFGNSGSLKVRANNGSLERSLVLFDLSLLPNAGVKQAILTLHVNSGPQFTRTYGAHALTNYWTGNASWSNRTTGVNNVSSAWGAAGGDFNATATDQASINQFSTSISFDISRDAQSWYDGTANFGTLIKDENETNRSRRIYQAVFSSSDDATPANRPSLTINFLQNVKNLTATPGNGSVTLNWAYPAPIGTVLEPYTGVVILRRANAPVDKNSAPADGQFPPSLCSTRGNGTVVFVGSMSDTSFTDSGTCGALSNGTQYFYKVFMRDSSNYYTTNGGSSTYTAEIGAVPGTTQTLAWTVATHSYNLGGGGIIPGAEMLFGSDSSQLFGVNLVTGERAFPPVSVGGTVSARPPMLGAAYTANGQAVAFITAQDGYVYAVDPSTAGNGQILWATNLGSVGANGNIFTGGASVQLKMFSDSSYTPSYDTVFVGTHNSSTSSANSILGINGSTGAVAWTTTGGTGSNPRMDMVNTTPVVDYVNHAVWVTSDSNGGSAQPNLWKLSPSDGHVIWSMNVGNAGDINSSPTLTAYGDVLFIGADNGYIYAINPAASSSATALLGSYNAGDGPIKGYPSVVSFTSPFTIVFTTNTKVQAVSFNKTGNTFTQLWSSQTFSSPSAPVVNFFTNKIYIGTGSDYVYQLELSNGAVSGSRVVDTGNNPMYIGDPTLDIVMNRIYVTTTTNDQRTYAYSIPF